MVSLPIVPASSAFALLSEKVVPLLRYLCWLEILLKIVHALLFRYQNNIDLIYVYIPLFYSIKMDDEQKIRMNRIYLSMEIDAESDCGYD